VCCAPCSAGIRPRRREDLQTVLRDEAHEAGGFSLQERTMLTNILALRGRRVDDVMVAARRHHLGAAGYFRSAS